MCHVSRQIIDIGALTHDESLLRVCQLTPFDTFDT